MSKANRLKSRDENPDAITEFNRENYKRVHFFNFSISQVTDIFTDKMKEIQRCIFIMPMEHMLEKQMVQKWIDESMSVTK